MALSHEEIYAKVQKILEDALGVDADEVKPDAIIKDDLGAESIDFLDISFQLEKAFGIKISKGEMMPEDLGTNPEFVQNDRFTPAGIAELKRRVPFADFTKFEADPTVSSMSKLFTVEMIVQFVQGKLKAV